MGFTARPERAEEDHFFVQACYFEAPDRTDAPELFGRVPSPSLLQKLLQRARMLLFSLCGPLCSSLEADEQDSVLLCGTFIFSLLTCTHLSCHRSKEDCLQRKAFFNDCCLCQVGCLPLARVRVFCSV